MNNSRSKFSTFEQRVDWLVNKENLWYDVYNNSLIMTPSLEVVTRKIINYMKRDGLFSPTTYWCDVKLKKEMYSAARIIRLRKQQ